MLIPYSGAMQYSFTIYRINSYTIFTVHQLFHALARIFCYYANCFITRQLFCFCGFYLFDCWNKCKEWGILFTISK